MSELGPSSFESPEHRHSMDSPGRNADMPFTNHELYGHKSDPQPPNNPLERDLGRKSEPLSPKNPLQHNLGRKSEIDYGDESYHHLPDHATDLSPAELGLFDHEVPGYEDGNGSPETKATTEVQRAMAEIEVAEQQIAEHTGLTGEALADATDEYLVAKVEHQEDFETEDAAHSVEDALVEIALEETGQKPSGGYDALTALEQEGFDTQVTKGVQRLHEQGAKLPDGQDAAEVIATAIDTQEAKAAQAETESAQQTKNREILRNSEMGEELEKAYLAAVEQDGRLADIAVVTMEDGDHRDAVARAAWAKNNQSGKHEIIINLNDVPASLAQYEDRINNFPMNTEKIAKTLGIEPGEVTPELLYVQAMIHEMGHTLEFMDYEEAGKTPEDHRHDRNTERERLPLERSVTELEKHKELVFGQWDKASAKASKKYSDHKHEQHTIGNFDELVDATADVYRDTKFEHAADVFAAEVLATQPELVSQLLRRAKGETVDYNKESKEAGWDSPERVQKLVERYIVPGSKVLDIGTGTGLAVQGYAEKGATVIALDHDTAMLDQARKVVGENGILRQADINKLLPISDLDGRVDVVQAVGVLEFASNLEGVIAQANISQKKGGVFAFTTEALAKVGSQSETTTAYPEAGVTVHRHSVAEITKMLHDSGYELVSHDRYDAYERGGGAVKYNMFLARKV